MEQVEQRNLPPCRPDARPLRIPVASLLAPDHLEPPFVGLKGRRAEAGAHAVGSCTLRVPAFAAPIARDHGHRGLPGCREQGLREGT
jgi:hypothetical protein